MLAKRSRRPSYHFCIGGNEMNDFAVMDEGLECAIIRSSHWGRAIAADDAVLELPQSDRAVMSRKEIRKYRASRTEKVVRIERCTRPIESLDHRISVQPGAAPIQRH